MRKNKIRELLNEGKPTLGTHVHSTWPSVIEVVGHTGMFDYVEFVAEYVPYDMRDLDHLCRAAELYDLGMMIKLDYSSHQLFAQRAFGSVSAAYSSRMPTTWKRPRNASPPCDRIRPKTAEASA